MAEKVTIMKLKVDLECEKCYKKVKKLLGKYPQIRDQRFDEKENIVFITVICCSPEKIRDKLCYKGGGSIKSIEILELPKPEKKKEGGEKPKAEPEKKKDGGEKPKAEPEKKKDGGDKPKSDAPKKDAGEKPKSGPEKKKDGGGDKPKDDKKVTFADKPKGEGPKKDDEKPKEKPAPAAMPIQPHIAPPMAVPVGMLYTPGPCYEGRPVGPGYDYGGPVFSYDGYYARPVYDSYGGGRPCYVNRCDQYFSDENPAGCTIM